MHTTDTSRSQSRSGSHLSHEEYTRAMQLEIDCLKRKLRHERRRRTFPTLIFLLVMRGMVATDPGQEFPLVNHSCVMRITTGRVGIIAHLARAWEMTP